MQLNCVEMVDHQIRFACECVKSINHFNRIVVYSSVIQFVLRIMATIGFDSFAATKITVKSLTATLTRLRYIFGLVQLRFECSNACCSCHFQTKKTKEVKRFVWCRHWCEISKNIQLNFDCVFVVQLVTITRDKNDADRFCIRRYLVS